MKRIRIQLIKKIVPVYQSKLQITVYYKYSKYLSFIALKL